MSSDDVDEVTVHLGGYKPHDPQPFGPLPGRRSGGVVAYEMQAPESFTPWPGRDRVERKYLLLDLGVTFGMPCWAAHTRPDGSVFTLPPEANDAWYVDLVTVEQPDPTTFVVRDLFLDVMIADGRQPRMLDLDEIADAHEAGWITTGQLRDGLRRWQRFLDQHVHASRFPQSVPTDFPPAVISSLAEIPGRFGPPVTWPEPPWLNESV
ncbi:DUF402 domain-containing protein [Propionibacteriaceae bacterium Y2011]